MSFDFYQIRNNSDIPSYLFNLYLDLFSIIQIFLILEILCFAIESLKVSFVICFLPLCQFKITFLFYYWLTIFSLENPFYSNITKILILRFMTLLNIHPWRLSSHVVFLSRYKMNFVFRI